VEQQSRSFVGPSRRNSNAEGGLQQQLQHHQQQQHHATVDQPERGHAGQTGSSQRPVIVPDWRLKERMRTVACGLALALNIDTPPPDTVRPQPCAVLTSWIDPTDRTKRNRTQAGEVIAERLEQQYSQWQRNLKFRHAIDPTFDQMRSLCERLRRDAKNDRLLLHFNGHGVPRPTDVGELWVVDKNKTEYIPIAMEEIKQWLGSPSLIILDCSNAATLIPYFCNTTLPPGSSMDEIASQWVKDVIILCPCGENEVLPLHPDYPADLFTSCLTTPIPMALRWFILKNPALGLKPDMVNLIPGNVSERKTPVGPR
jgi:regulatory associated protein of mTOR